MKKIFNFLNFVRSEQGFSLIESAISVLVLSTVSISVMSLFKISMLTYENQKIQSHELFVKNALQEFYKNNKRMPRPSFDNSGIENYTANTNSDILTGYIPYKTLEITADEASDTKGHIMTYTVSKYDCIDVSQNGLDDTPTIDNVSLKNLFAKSRLFMSTNGNNAEIYFAIMPQNIKLQKSGANIFITKNSKILAMSKNAFLNGIK